MGHGEYKVYAHTEGSAACVYVYKVKACWKDEVRERERNKINVR